MLVTCQRFGDLFLFGLVGSILQFRQNMIKVGSKSWLLTCSSNITLSLPSQTVSALQRELSFCNGYLRLLYFWVELILLLEHYSACGCIRLFFLSGGTLGLFTGMSILSMVEMVFWIFTIPLSYFSRSSQVSKISM